MGPFLRNVTRYGVGVLFGLLIQKGLVSQEFADLFLKDEWFMTTIQLVAATAGTITVEYLYSLAKERGWKT